MGKKQTTSDSKKAPVDVASSAAGKKPAKAAAAKVEKKVAKPAQPKPATPKVKAVKVAEAPTTVKPAAVRTHAKSASGPSSEEIALRAYYIAEKRLKLGLPGDSANDWIEAERQIRAESKTSK